MDLERSSVMPEVSFDERFAYAVSHLHNGKYIFRCPRHGFKFETYNEETLFEVMLNHTHTQHKRKVSSEPPQDETSRALRDSVVEMAHRHNARHGYGDAAVGDDLPGGNRAAERIDITAARHIGTLPLAAWPDSTSALLRRTIDGDPGDVP